MTALRSDQLTARGPLRTGLAALVVAALALAAAIASAPAAAAQTFTSAARETPADASDLERLATGDAVAALPTLDSPFTANPAHVVGRGLSLNVLGATVGLGGNARESYAFYADRLGPAIEEGLEQIRRDDPDRLEALYAEALRVGASPKTADLAVLAPSLQVSTGAVGLGVGAYARGASRARVVDGGAGIPVLDGFAQADLAVPVVVGLDLDRATRGLVPGVRVGLRATYLQRRVTTKTDPVDALDPDGEKLYVLRGDAVRLAAGLYARDLGVPGLDLGAEVSNLGGAVTYTFDRSIAVSGSKDRPDDAVEIARLERQFDGREPQAVVRVGAAYRLPAYVPGVADAALALDYTSASTADLDQSVQAGLRAGVRARLAGFLDLRAGLSQGMPSAGVGLRTRVARLEYATYGVEDGRLLGQSRRRNHVVQLRLGWF